MANQKDFDAFLKNIEPSHSTVKYISSVQNNLRNYLKNHEEYQSIFNDSFLSGSYAKHTSIRPSKNDKKRDVDIIVVTGYNDSDDSIDVLVQLQDVLKESNLYNSATLQHHSIGIELEGISIDVVPVIVDKNDSELYFIGDCKLGNWCLTDPKGHKQWSTTINQNSNCKYKPLVKIFKWWRRINCPEGVRFPKGITLEKIIADHLGEPSSSTEDLLIETMNNIVTDYQESYVDKELVPIIDDPSGKIEDNNLLEGYTFSDFSTFINKLSEHVQLLNTEGTGNEIWRKILGTEFPKESTTKISSSSLIQLRASHRKRIPWPFSKGGVAFIALEVKDNHGHTITYNNNGEPLEKGCSLFFRAYTGVKKPYYIKWQITNTGKEATEAGCLRGDFEASNIDTTGRYEETSYTGSHIVQCFVIKKGVCVAKSKEYIINIK